MPLYFAYGSNMDVAAMAARCPRSRPLGLARLPRHSFALTRRGFATVTRAARGEVWGLLWTLALADVPALDRYEEISRGLYAKKMLPVIRDGGAAVQALIYIARNEDAPGQAASPAYGEEIVRAAGAAGVPANYLGALEAAFSSRAAPARGFA